VLPQKLVIASEALILLACKFSVLLGIVGNVDIEEGAKVF